MRRSLIADSASRNEAVCGHRLARGSLAGAHPLADAAQRQELQPEPLAADEIADEIVGRVFEHVERGAALDDPARGP